jgi:acyl-CoA synthetase (AMP-forming)/AMP-acid ligase II/esterase/lipase/1-acyl-sn-glycerol-3-phosphate acyltransferase
MSGSPDFEIKDARYEWCVRAFSLLRRRLGINIKVHNADHHFEAGQIFVFNHFARFETIIPQYLIHQATGAFCRCVAAGELFTGNQRFANFLWSVGAVPNDHPGLLAFLAAEILRGRKVIFFPEGGMIKDRRVVDDDGQFSILSPSTQTPRKHHQGAAATALTLEIFKKRILSVQEAGDTRCLQRWVRALRLESIDALIRAARQPTLIIPANITFYPIHTGDNILRKGAELFGQDLSRRAKEELLIEGNLLLKRTDMDIRFGEAVYPEVAWNVGERLILSKVFERVESLEELFALKDAPSRWLRKMVGTAMRRETQRLRDICMQEIYAHVTVNLNHLASLLVLRLLDHGIVEIDCGRFHRLLFVALKSVQAAPSVDLHRGLRNPAEYDGVHDGSCPAFRAFLETAIASGLIEITAGQYRLLPKLRQKHPFHEMRLENVVTVYANEVAPIADVRQAVDAAIAAGSSISKAALAQHLFDDEIRAYAWCKQRYSRHRHAVINGQQTATESGEPYLLVPERPKAMGIVLVHGFLASPAELKAFGERLAALGYPVIGVRLNGHGTSPWDLRDRSWQHWLASVRRGYEIMSHLTDRVCIVGFSTGGSLGLCLAAESPAALAGVVAVSAPLRFRNQNLIFVPIVHGLNRLTEWASPLEGIMPFRVHDSEHPDINYHHIPIRGLLELRRIAEELERRLPDVTCSVRIIQGTEDRVVDPVSAKLIVERVGSSEKSLHMIPSQRHGILNEDIGDTQALTISFIESIAPAASPDLERNSVALPPARANVDRIVSAFAARLRSINVADRMSCALRPFIAKFSRAAPRAGPRRDLPYPWEKSYPRGVDWRATIDAKPVTALLDEAVRMHADKTCLSFRGRQYRYREIGRLVDRAAKGFQALGVGKGIKVGLMLPNCPYAVVCFYAVLKAGGTVVNINPLYAQPEIEQQIQDSGLCILVTLDAKEFYDKAAPLADGRGRVEKLVVCRVSGALRFREKVLFDLLKSRGVASVPDDDRNVLFERLIDNDGAPMLVAIDPARDIAVHQYTGGTTGSPKGAQLTHANLYANAMQIRSWATAAKCGEEKALAVLPLFHAFGMTAVMNLSLSIGAEIVLLPNFRPTEVLEAIDRERPTIFFGVPTMYSALAMARDIANYDLSSLRFCISGGAPLPGEVQRRFEDLSGCALVEGYGLSEASPVCTVNPLTGGKSGSVGLPLPGTLIEIVSLDDPDRVLGLGERGEICITGPQVMAGYANRAQDNVDVFRGGRLHTGDVGYLDADGYLYVVDRIKDLIICGGFNVYPRMVEDVIQQHPAVSEVAVCGLPDLHRGEIVKAFVALREGQTLTAAELRGFLKDKLAPFQMPRQIAFRDSLPKTAIGKISKKELAAELAARSEDDPAPRASA